MRTTESDEHHGHNTQGREVLRCSDELRHPCRFREHGHSGLDIPQHQTGPDHFWDLEPRGSWILPGAVSNPDNSRSAFLLDLLQPGDAIGGTHLSFGKTHRTINRWKELLTTCFPSHAQPTIPNTNCSKTETDGT